MVLPEGVRNHVGGQALEPDVQGSLCDLGTFLGLLVCKTETMALISRLDVKTVP